MSSGRRLGRGISYALVQCIQDLCSEGRGDAISRVSPSPLRRGRIRATIKGAPRPAFNISSPSAHPPDRSRPLSRHRARRLPSVARSLLLSCSRLSRLRLSSAHTARASASDLRTQRSLVLCRALSPDAALTLSCALAFFRPLSSSELRFVREYGDVTDIYSCDTFNENTPPTSDPTYISSLGSAVCKAMSKADKDAVWLMQELAGAAYCSFYSNFSVNLQDIYTCGVVPYPTAQVAAIKVIVAQTNICIQLP